MLSIVHVPNPALSQVAKPIVVKNGVIDKLLLTLISEMKETLSATIDPEGVGLAAPQVGKSLQLFLVKQTPRSPVSVFINPVILTHNAAEPEEKRREENPRESVLKSAEINDNDKEKKLEGCLSLPNIWGEVKRTPTVTMSYIDEAGKTRKKTFKGFFATILQHEYDHLQGILFPKRVLEQQGTLYKSHKNKKGEEEFDEIEI